MGAPFSSKAVSSDPIFLLQEANFCNNFCSSLKTGETLCIQDFTPEKKKGWGGLPASRISMCLSKNLPPFLFPDQTFTNLFPVFEIWGQNHQCFVDTCGLNALIVFFWFSCSCVRSRSNFRFSTRTRFLHSTISIFLFNFDWRCEIKLYLSRSVCVGNQCFVLVWRLHNNSNYFFMKVSARFENYHT